MQLDLSQAMDYIGYHGVTCCSGTVVASEIIKVLIALVILLVSPDHRLVESLIPSLSQWPTTFTLRGSFEDCKFCVLRDDFLHHCEEKAHFESLSAWFGYFGS